MHPGVAVTFHQAGPAVGRPSGHDVGSVTLLLLLFTALCAASVPGFLKTWRGESTVAAVPRLGFLALIKRRQDKIRAGPALLISGYLLCLTGWVLAFSGRGPEMSVLAGVLVVVSFGASVTSFFCVATVVLFNRPKCLVPPHLRRQWGSVKARQLRNQRYRAEGHTPE